MPLLSPPPPSASRGGSSRRLGRIRRRRSRRNWAALPLDVLLHVFHKLDHVNLMFGGASRACRSWRSAAREPELWRRIDLRGHSLLFRQTISLDRMARLAIWFSAGQCMSFKGEHDYVNGDLLLFLSERAPLLKSLRLTEFYHRNAAFVEAIKNFPLLEELELCQWYNRDITWIINLFAIASPNLKHLKHVKRSEGYRTDNSDALAIARMQGLRSLQLFRGDLDNEGLTAILDNCPHLESLDLCSCSDVVIDSSLRDKCGRIKTKKLYPYAHNEFTKYFEPGSLASQGSSFRTNDSDERDCWFLHGWDHDSDDYYHSCYFSRADETDFEEHKRIFHKGTRRRRRRYLRT